MPNYRFRIYLASGLRLIALSIILIGFAPGHVKADQRIVQCSFQGVTKYAAIRETACRAVHYEVGVYGGKQFIGVQDCSGVYYGSGVCNGYYGEWPRNGGTQGPAAYYLKDTCLDSNNEKADYAQGICVVRDNSKQGGCPSGCGKNSLGVGDPANSATGNEYQREIDYQVADGNLRIERHYNSQSAFDVGLGPGWSASFLSHLEFVGDGSLRYHDGTGRIEDFTGASTFGPGTTTDISGAYDACVAQAKAAQTGWSTSERIYACGVWNNWFNRYYYNVSTKAFVYVDKFNFSTQSCSSGASLARWWTDGKRGFAWSYIPIPERPLINYGHPCAAKWEGDSDTALEVYRSLEDFRIYDRSGRQKVFDLSGKLIETVNASGKYRDKGYSYNGSTLASVSDRYGYSLAVNTSGTHVSSIDSPSGQVVAYEYDQNNRLIKATYADNRIRQYLYEDTNFPNSLTGIIDENGARFATLTYSSTGQVASTEHAGGQERVELSYDSPNQTTVTDNGGTQIVETFDRRLGVSSMTSKTNLIDYKQISFAYDTNNNLISETNEEGQTTNYTYNQYNQLTGKTEASGTAQARTTTYEYASTNSYLVRFRREASVVSGAQFVTEYRYEDADNKFLPTTIIESGYRPDGTPVSRTTTKAYNSDGKVLQISGPRTDVSDVTSYTYSGCVTGSGCGRLTSVTNPLGQVTTYDAYDTDGRILQVTAPNGVTTNLTYDSRGRVATMMSTPSAGVGRTIQYTYDWIGQLQTMTLPTGKVITYTYNSAHQIIGIHDNLNNSISFEYDSRGNRTSKLVYDPFGQLTETLNKTFDSRNYVVSINHGGSLSTFTVDALGNVIQTVDPNTNSGGGGSAVLSYHDVLNRVYQQVDQQSGVTTYGYDARDNLVEVTAPNGSVTTYSYDDLGNRISESSSDRGTIQYGYNSAGNLTSKLDSRGIVVNYQYDALGRVIDVDYPGTSEDIVNTYDNCDGGVGQLCQITDGSGSTSYSYNGFGQIQSKTQVVGSTSFVTSYLYDDAGRVTSMTTPAGNIINYGYDQDLVSSISLGSTTLISGITYRPFGPPKTWTFGNNITSTRAYNLKGEIQELDLGPQHVAINYDYNGNILGFSSASENTIFTYDFINRITDATSTNFNLNYSYDVNGNRTSLIDGGGITNNYTYVTDTNQLEQIDNGSSQIIYTYDSAGNTLSDGTRNFIYNSAGELQSVSGATYYYNASHQRVRKLIDSSSTYFVYDEFGQLLGEYDNSGSIIQETVWLDTIPVVTIKNGQIYYVHSDHLNSPRVITDTQNTVVWEWTSDPFGGSGLDEDPDGDGNNFTYNLRFPGQYYDSETGLYYNYYRYYDPKTGRYITSDPIGLGGGLNTYNYTANNPLRFADPKGLCLEDACVVEGIVVGAIVRWIGSRLVGAGAVWMAGEIVGEGEKDDAEDLPYFPGLDPKKCNLGRRVVLPIPQNATMQKKYKGGTNIEQEYICECDKVFTRHTIISKNGTIVHDHFRPGPPKGILGD